MNAQPEAAEAAGAADGANLLKESEVHRAVIAMLHIVWMRRKVVIAAVFQHEDSLRTEQRMLRLKDKIGNLLQVFQSIRWISKDDIKGL